MTYLAPRLVAEIAYEELTADRKLRQPVFLGLRDDKTSARRHTAGGEMNLEKLITHPDKVFWPEEGYTKLDLARFYESVFPKLKPYVADRMLSLERCPDGMSGGCFYQKEAPKGLPPAHADQGDPASESKCPLRRRWRARNSNRAGESGLHSGPRVGQPGKESASSRIGWCSISIPVPANLRTPPKPACL